MEAFDISWSAIFKLMLAWGGAYVVQPALMIMRDLLIHFFIGKLILTEGLGALIMRCENDRWFLKNKYNQSCKMSCELDKPKFEIGGKSVPKEEFNQYMAGQNFHEQRFRFADSKIIFRQNLINWLICHYKLSESANPIPSLREHYYQAALSMCSSGKS